FIADVEASPSFIIEVVAGDDEGLAWIVDPMLDDKEMHKFSGSNQAGTHREDDLMGTTCDALAHFSLADSEGSMVFVDIQGKLLINHPSGVNRHDAHDPRKPDVLVLFDVMCHTVDKAGGLGDRGKAGIQKFMSQHKCNAICKALGLEEFG
ncbi:kinase-like protein, partial [Agrocybe pediades]